MDIEPGGVYVRRLEAAQLAAVEPLTILGWVAAGELISWTLWREGFWPEDPVVYRLQDVLALRDKYRR